MVTKEMIEKLKDENITRKQYNEIQDKISARADEIWRYICQVTHRRLSWWDFSNGMEENTGFFDSTEYADEVLVQGGYDYKNDIYSMGVGDGFPTYYLWTPNYQEVVLQELEAFKQQQKDEAARRKAQREARKERLKILHASIREKLTKDELKSITFKK